jgi:hypothetical protein
MDQPTPRPALRPLKLRPDAPQLAWAAQPNYRTQLIAAAIERKSKKRS